MSVSGYSGFDPSQSAASERNKTRLYSAPGYETARVLITVKTSPNPSAKYGDTVCVAGIRTDREAYEWIRLYPVNFRWLSAEH
ncbi:hypothetical protein EII30_05595 [Leucobacter sp. OH1287]|nr:hypothetical protein EII30_05595 [Leucobacter sp. OH1287]